jgi:NTP pyrophosphatase (non-canonical NTP hydrolase)
MTIQELCEISHAIAKDKGWWDLERPIGDIFANFHAEISEAWEEFRTLGMDPNWFIYYNDGSEKPEGIAVELADVLIRIADFVAKFNLPIEEALEQKGRYNATRPYRHGGKKA